MRILPFKAPLRPCASCLWFSLLFMASFLTSFLLVELSVYAKPNCDLTPDIPICGGDPPPPPPPSPLPPGVLRVAISMTELWCTKENDDFLQGNTDEIYLVVTGKRMSDSRQYKYRLPGSNAYWRAKPENGPRLAAGLTNILTDTLSNGDSISLVISVVEEDTSWLASILDLVAEASFISGDPYLIASGKIAPIFTRYLQDDLIGTVAIRVQNENGVLRYETRPVDYSYRQSVDIPFYVLYGSDSQYNIRLEALSK